MDRKAQEEIVGFVAIVVIISIIGLIFIGITMKDNGARYKESKDVRMFLGSALEYTTDCEITSSDYATVQDLIKECYSNSGRVCVNGKEVCKSLNDTLTGLLSAGYRKVGDDAYIKGYVFNATYGNATSGDEKDIISVAKGNCSTNTMVGGDQFFSAYPGKIYANLRLCY